MDDGTARAILRITDLDGVFVVERGNVGESVKADGSEGQD
jgi:hypothetical protein